MPDATGLIFTVKELRGVKFLGSTGLPCTIKELRDIGDFSLFGIFN